MHKIYTFLLAILLVNVTVAQASNTIDSIGVENHQGKKVIIYKVEAKETYYSIARKYNLNHKDIMEFNDSKYLQIGVILKIPTQLPYGDLTASPLNQSNATELTYTVKAKDNLNLIASKYATTVDEIKSINQLSSNNLQIGQVLKIPSGSTPQGTASVETVSAPVRTVTTTKNVVKNVTTRHTVKANETLGGIALKYNTTVDHLKSQNGLKSANLKIGQVLKMVTKKTVKVQVEVPVEASETYVAAAAQNETPKSINNTNDENQLTHTVAAGETIFAIAQKYGTTTYQITTANNLTNNNLTVGQKLIIKNAARTSQIATIDDAGTSTLKDPTFKGPASRYGLSQVEEKGAAIWIEDQDLDPAKMLILHRTAPVGTIMKITNPMTNRSAFAKVVGKFTENESTKDVIIVMTKAVADAVGALDKRFFCNLSYGSVDNEQQ